MLPERRALTRTSLGQMECKTSLKIVIRNCALCPRPVETSFPVSSEQERVLEAMFQDVSLCAPRCGVWLNRTSGVC